jgi:hypothetical protein
MIRTRRSFTPSLLAALVALAAAAPSFALAQNWTEVGDAGSFPASAQITLGTGALQTISGTIATNIDEDVYCLHIADAAAFSACLQCTIISGPDVYLFDSTGKGVALAQICSSGCKTIPPGFVTSPGTYYIAVVASGALALAGSNPIWQAGSTMARAPDGPGAGSPITAWGGAPQLNGPGAYVLSMAGAGFCGLATPAVEHTWGQIKSTYQAHP